jgi:predicted nuclease of predicted toxin-antitoxin system
MTVLFDENIPRKLKWRLMERGIDVVTVPERGWAGVKNGELLDRAEEEFDVLLTMDQGIEYQQNLAGRELAIVTVAAPTNEYETLLPLVPEIVDAARKATKGAVISLAA